MENWESADSKTLQTQAASPSEQRDSKTDQPPQNLSLKDLDLVQQCLEGDTIALDTLQNKYNRILSAHLLMRGARPCEIDDIMHDLWTDCVVDRPDHPALFTRFDGRLELCPWLRTIVTNRWLSFKRTEARHIGKCDRAANAAQDMTPAVRDIGLEPDPHVIHLLARAIRIALGRCDAEMLVLIQLVHVHRVAQRDIAALWSWHESRVSRAIQRAEKYISESTIQVLQELDPHLSLQWEDLLDLCSTHNFLSSEPVAA